MRAILSLIRWPNLLIVAFTQSIVYYKLIYLNSNDSASDLGITLFGLLVISTMLIAASGYIINDIIDIPIDQINKPKTRVIENKITIKSAWRLYWSSVLLGFLVSLYVAIQIDNVPLVLIYPFAIFLLYGYSLWWKKRALIGNMIVSLFSCFVIGIVWFAERNFVTINNNEQNQIIDIFLGFMVFSFLVSMYREIIKDLQDQPGDKQLDYKTLPLAIGPARAKFTALIFGGFLLVLSVLWGARQYSQYKSGWLELLYLLVFICLALLIIISKTNQAKSTLDFKIISSNLKYLMLSGLVYLTLLH